MSMDAKSAAEKINNGNFDFNNADELYELYKALNSEGSGKYLRELERLKQYIEENREKEIKKTNEEYEKAISIEKDLQQCSADKSVLDDEILSELNNVEIIDNEQSPENSSSKDDKLKQQILDVAQRYTETELRGPLVIGNDTLYTQNAQNFAQAENAEERKKIYKETLKENVKSILTQAAQVTEAIKIKAASVSSISGIFINGRKALYKNSQMALGRIRVSGEAVMNTCAQRMFCIENSIKEYKGKIQAKTNEINDRIKKYGLRNLAKALNSWHDGKTKLETYLAEASEKRIKVSNQCVRLWKQGYSNAYLGIKQLDKYTKQFLGYAKKTVENVIDPVMDSISYGVDQTYLGCRSAFHKTQKLGGHVVKYIKDNKGEITADLAATCGYTVALATGGTAAFIGGGAYAAYTIGRRVIYEAYKQKKANPEKSYKEIYTDKKFIIRTASSCVAAACSCAVGVFAGIGTNASANVAAKMAENVAQSRLAGRIATVFGAVSANVVGLCTCKPSERKKEAMGLCMTILGAVGTQALIEYFSSAEHNVNTSENDTHTTEIKTEEAHNAMPQKTEEDYVSNLAADEIKNFPTEWDKDMGISRRQFEVLQEWYGKFDTNGSMDRIYQNAAKYAADLSLSQDNLMTPEQVLFKFSRLVAITSVKNGEFGTIGTGSLGTQLEDIYKMLGCDETLTGERLETARKTLDICTLNEASRADGRMDAKKFIDMAGEGYGKIAVDSDQTVSMTKNIRVIGEGSNCPEDVRVAYEETASKAPAAPVEATAPVTPAAQAENLCPETVKGVSVLTNTKGNLNLPNNVPHVTENSVDATRIFYKEESNTDVTENLGKKDWGTQVERKDLSKSMQKILDLINEQAGPTK